MTTEDKVYDVVIAGQGAAAYSAALYAARYQMDSVVIGETFGGETAIGGLIENYPGYPEIDGFDLMLKFREQAERYNVPIVDDTVVDVKRSDHCFETVTAAGSSYFSSTVIWAIGRERRSLGLPNEKEWTGKGVSYCSVCDAPLHRDNAVAVVGGGSAAVEGALLLSKYARKVYIVYRQSKFTRPEPVIVKRLDQASNVERLMNTNIVGLKGDDGLTGAVLDRAHNGSKELELDGLFVEIGADPRVELPKRLGIEVNDADEITVDKQMNTSVHGFIAAGDVTDASGSLKQTVTAAAQGAIAATTAYDDISEHPNACQWHARAIA